jgi:hypothetical protein
MNKIFAVISISILTSSALLAADAKPAPPAAKPAPIAAPSKPGTEPAPVELKTKSAPEGSAIALKNKSSFNVDAGTRSPFWPISWKPAGKVASGGTDQGEVPPGAFVVTTITVDGGAHFAIINGKSMGEGQQFGLQIGTQVYQVTVKRIEDGRVILGRRDEEIVVPLRRK